MKKSILKAVLAMAIIIVLPNLVNAQADWNTQGNAPGVNNYFGTNNSSPIRFATATGGINIGTNQRMVITATGNVGIGQRAGTTNPTVPLNKLLVENGNIYDAGAFDGIYDRLKALIPVPPFPSPAIADADFSLIAYSNRGITDGHNFAITGYTADAAAEANFGVSGIAMEGQTNVGLNGAAMNGTVNNVGVNAAVNVGTGIVNTNNRGITVSVLAEDNADNTGLEMEVTGSTNANSNSGIAIDISGDNAANNQGMLLNIDAGGSGTDNSGYNTTISGTSTSNSNTAFTTTVSCNATNENVGAFMNITGTSGSNNRGYVTTVSGSATNSTGSELNVSGGSNQNVGERVTVTGNGNINLGLDIDVDNGSSDATGLSASVNGGAVGASILGAGLYVDANGSQWSKGIDGFATGATSGNAGGLFSANAAGTNAFAIGVQGEVLNAGNYLNYAVYGDYVVAGNNGTNYAGFFNGDVFSATNFYTSDPKLKENIKEYKGALEQLSKINIKKYTYRTNEFPGMNLPQGEQVGLLSTNLKEVFPNLVKQAIYPGSMRGKEDIKFDAVNTNALVPVLVQAVKELDAKNVSTEEMKKEIEALKADKAAVNKELETVKTDNEALKKDMTEMKEMLDKICSNGCGDFKPASTLGGTTGSESGLFQNVPNPFSNTTVIPYTIGQGVKHAVLIITNLNGNELKRFTTSQTGAGTFEVNMDEFGASTYVYSLFTDGKLIDTKKMVLAGK